MQNKTLNGPRVHGISAVGKEKVYGGKDVSKSQVAAACYTEYFFYEYSSKCSSELHPSRASHF